MQLKFTAELKGNIIREVNSIKESVLPCSFFYSAAFQIESHIENIKGLCCYIPDLALILGRTTENV